MLSSIFSSELLRNIENLKHRAAYSLLYDSHTSHSLINSPLNLNRNKGYSVTALYLATTNKDCDENLLQHFLNCELPISITKANGQTLWADEEDQSTYIVRLLLYEGANGTIIRDSSEEMTALHWAVLYGCEPMVNLLLEKGIAVDERGVRRYGFSALHLATIKKSNQMVALLLAHGADINMANRSGKTALHLAVQNNDIDMVSFLLSKGASINALDGSDKTALHHAVSEGREDIIILLLDHKADINAQDDLCGRGTALHLAVIMCDLAVETRKPVKILELLLEKGANINAQSSTGQTPLHCAASYDHFPVVSVLLNRGAEIDIKDYKGNTALHTAVAEHSAEHSTECTVNILLKKGANIEARNNRCESAIEIALQSGTIQMVLFLSDKGASW